MLKKLRARFIFFNMLIISGVLIVLSLSVLWGTKSDLAGDKFLIVILFSLGVVCMASFLLSKFALAPIKRAWQKQLDFTADASHELRTPITVIQTNLELVMDNSEETVESQKKWLENIYAENKRMAKLVDDLLTLSRADTNQQNLSVTTFMLDNAIQEAVMPFEPIADEKNIVLHTSIHSPIAFKGDENRIRQLIIILVDNALKYTPSGSISINLKRNDKGAVLTVSDTGTGIEPEHLNKIFDRFYRVTETRKQNEDGSGLGLSIAKWIVSEHGGSIRVESEPEIGTKFTVILPERKKE